MWQRKDKVMLSTTNLDDNLKRGVPKSHLIIICTTYLAAEYMMDCIGLVAMSLTRAGYLQQVWVGSYFFLLFDLPLDYAGVYFTQTSNGPSNEEKVLELPL